MVKFTLAFLLVYLILVEVNSKAVTERMTNEIQTRRSVSKTLATDLLNSVFVKSRQNKQNIQRVKRGDDWPGYIIVPPYCIPASVDCPCDACGYCCKGQCNSNPSSPCTC